MHTRSRILIVDDSTASVAILRKMLKEGYCLQSACSGEEAIEIASQFRPDLILLDIVMPGIDGYEVCRRLREDPVLGYTKVIMVSSKSSIEERLEGYEAGANDYVTKPFHKAELLAKVKVYLQLKSIEELDRLKTDLLTLLAHETDTPLSAILPTLDMVMADTDMDPEERNALLGMARECAENLQKIFSKVLTLSSLKAGTTHFSIIEEDLGFIVQSAVQEAEVNSAEGGVSILVNVPDAAEVEMDMNSIKFVVEALLDNAIKFSPRGGEVLVNVAEQGAGFNLEVTDQGEGIEPSFLPRVFDEFSVRDIDHHSAGLGLSLSLARQIVHGHNGTINVSSIQGVGTNFTVWLPSQQS